MPEINDDDLNALTAYLDGELDEQASQAFEARLSRDPELRAEADALKRTWEMLDYLPKPEPSTNFTHRTLERLAVLDTAPAVPVSAPGRWAWLTPVTWAAAMLVAMAGGLYTAHRLWPVPQPVAEKADFEAKMARNLGPIENLRVFGNVSNIDEARQIAEALDEEEGP